MSKSFGPVMFFEKPIPLPKMVMVTDQAPEQLPPELKEKLSRVIALLEKLVAEDRPAAADVMAAKKAQRRENARRLRERDAKYETPEDRVTVPAKFLEDAIRQAAYEAACEARQAAYAARNPHKAQQDAPQETRLQYPHKPRRPEAWEDRLATRDSAMSICQQCEAAYARRNPHKQNKHP